MALHTKLKDLPNLPVKGLTLMTCKYSPVNTPIGPDRLTLMASPSLMRIVAQHRVAQLSPDTLWWNTGIFMPNELAVVRQKVRRRVSTAIKEGLKEKGYDNYGRSNVEGKPGLKGSLEVKVFNKSVLLRKFSRIKKEALLVLDEVEWRSSRESTAQATTHHTRGSMTDRSHRRAQPSDTSSKVETSNVNEKHNVPHAASVNADAGNGQTTQSAKPQTAKPDRVREVHRGYIPYRDLAR